MTTPRHPGSTNGQVHFRPLVAISPSPVANEPRTTTAELLLAALVHELGNPLTAVTASIELALRRLDAGAVDLAALRLALTDAELAGRHAREVLATMRTLTGPTDESHAVPLTSLIEEAATLVRAETDGAIAIDPDLPAIVVRTGRSEARQILVNLLRNAIQASRRGAGTVAVTAVAAPSAVVVEIRDDGPGIDDALAARLFSAFSRGAGGGAGLGLHVSRQLAARIGASLSLANRTDARGAVATLVLRTAC
jgi:signal transduction histidine kinase